MTLSSRKTHLLILCFALLAACAVSAHAQSGRRNNNPAPAAPVPTPTPEPTPTPRQTPKEPDIGFMIGADRNTTFETYPLSYYEAAMVGFADRVRSGSSAFVDISNTNLSRGEAIKKAKESKKTYVVYLKFALDESARSLDDLELQFVVFAPETGKVVSNITSYLNTNRKGPITTGPRTSTGGALYREDALKRSGADAADRILKALNLSVPVLH